MRYWLSYDLGLRGNYDVLYAWLDGLHAKECGDSCATFVSELTVEEIIRRLKEALDWKPAAIEFQRVYLIWLKEENGKTRPAGKFILGSRKRAPWVGYAGSDEGNGEDEE